MARCADRPNHPPVLTLPDTAAFAAVLADPRFPAALTIAVLAGGVRGFSGFGSALIYMPLMSAVYGPPIAAVTFLLVDLITGTFFSVRALPQVQWREIIPLVVPASVTAPLGALALTVMNPIHLRWILFFFVLVALVAMVTGWRYSGRPRLPITMGVGACAGILGGAVQISGVPILIYWFGSTHSALVIRANLIVFFTLMSISLGIIYLVKGLITPQVMAIAVFAAPALGLAMQVGSYFFHRTSETVYRRAAYVIVASSALLSMPLLDPYLR